MGLDIAESREQTLAQTFVDRIRAPDFPCVGAKSALARDNLRVETARDLTSGWNDVELHRKLLEWAWAAPANREELRSLAVVFEGPLDLDEQAFERAMWTRLQSFADKDAWLGQDYDRQVSADPTHPDFSLSFGGEAFFVVGLHPHASRPARRFPNPTLVFNLHDQFERLREEGRYERMRERILERDVALAGDINPMLSRHGESSEARQYSGRKVDAEWQCPFRDPRA
ncbi:YqcI/YcgG family protein [Erythrobacter sp. 3-20A1M]|uniref:guanitoxin biosynthesis heme-dependent pre-guanitoxin N-hydroxylase GntA n=1 Tax=Erythrobacter sp. 3-20A1M TaxID=2653850 RepID=UPI001BFC2F05|nr:guanitoxin biosynthesis heme-dependent pre-guanitoxin N-hydroxylase GntA [Erythrobacter sp. 3-20A1M]QWC56008.1 YqcI/YcgG family protein [Erythrobacter sp. 3-20A1M]